MRVFWGTDNPDEAGFTLIELVIVVALLGVVTGLVILNSVPFRDGAESSACRSDLATVRSAANAFEVKHDRYPSTMSELVTEAYLKDYPVGTSATSDGEFTFDPDSLPATVTRPC